VQLYNSRTFKKEVKDNLKASDKKIEELQKQLNELNKKQVEQFDQINYILLFYNDLNNLQNNEIMVTENDKKTLIVSMLKKIIEVEDSIGLYLSPLASTLFYYLYYKLSSPEYREAWSFIETDYSLICLIREVRHHCQEKLVQDSIDRLFEYIPKDFFTGGTES
jgi:hypothetical protein